MSKLRCPCGHIIIDQSDDHEYIGSLISNIKATQCEIKLSDRIADLYRASSSGVLHAWLVDEFGPGYPEELTMSSIVSDLITKYLSDACIPITECEKCGRLLVESDNGTFHSYISDAGYQHVIRYGLTSR